MQINSNYSMNGVSYETRHKQNNIPQFSTECAVQENENINQYMAEPLVYVCDCYQKFNVVTGMPKSTFGDSFGYDMQKDISSHMTDFYAGKVSRMNLIPILRNVVLPCVPIGQVSIRHPEPMKQIIHKS